MERKQLVLLFAVLMFVTLISTISMGADQELSGTLRVSTSANSGRPGLMAVVPLFEKEYPNIKVEPEFGDLGSATYTAQLMTQLQSKAAPDVFSAFPGSGTFSPSIGSLGPAGSLMDLSGTQMAKNIFPTTKDAVTVNGKVYATCLGVQFTALIYNTEKFNEFGLTPPTTFDELIALVKTIRQKSPDSIPIAFGGGNAAIAAIVASMMVVNEPEFSMAETKFADSAAWKAGLQQLLTLQEAGAYSPKAATDDANSIISQVTSGQAFMSHDCTSRFSALKKAAPDLPIAMAPFPGPQLEATQLMIWPGTMETVNAEAKNKAAAIAFIEFISRPDINRAWVDAAGGAEFPPSLMGELSKWPAHFESLKVYADKTVMIPCVTWPTPGTANALGKGIPAILVGQKTIDQVLTEMDASWGK